MKGLPDPNGVRLNIGTLSGPNVVADNDMPHVTSVISAPFTAVIP